MKFLSALTLALTAPLLTLANSDYQNALACAEKPWGAHVNAAISKFCNKRGPRGHLTDDLVVPSEYATNGATVGKAHVGILGSCYPAQWVPLQYCAPQFHSMCANGEGSKFWGWKNECQQFFITHG